MSDPDINTEIVEPSAIEPSAVAITSVVAVDNLVRAIEHYESEAERISHLLGTFVNAYRASVTAYQAKADTLRAILLDHVQRHGPVDMPHLRVSVAKGRERVEVTDPAMCLTLLKSWGALDAIKTEESVKAKELKTYIEADPKAFKGVAEVVVGEATLKITRRG